MIDDRKASILRAIVEEYIQTAEPVGSNTVMAAANMHVSAATIRNDMVALEREGFLAATAHQRRPGCPRTRATASSSTTSSTPTSAAWT